MQKPSRAVVSVVAFAIAVAGCARRSSTDPAVSSQPDASAILKAAAAATFELASFRAVVKHAIGQDQPGGEAIVDYVAPDRKRSSLGSNDVDITIGSTLYISVLGRPGYFNRLSLPKPGSLRRFLPEMQWVLGAEEVRREGSAFRFTFPQGDLSPGGSGEARVLGDRLVWLSIRYEIEGEGGTVQVALSMFNSAPPVNPPPADRVIPYESGLTPCGPDGSPPPGEIICGSVGTPEGGWG